MVGDSDREYVAVGDSDELKEALTLAVPDGDMAAGSALDTTVGVSINDVDVDWVVDGDPVFVRDTTEAEGVDVDDTLFVPLDDTV